MERLSAKLFGLFVLILLLGCGGSSDKEPASVVKLAPNVIAGEDQTAPEQSEVTLISKANDSDGRIESYLWQQKSGLLVSLYGTSLESAYFITPEVDKEEILSFSVVVTDNDGLQATDTINVTVHPEVDNSHPIADAGNDLTINEQSEVILYGQGIDHDGVIYSYLWQQTSGTQVFLSGYDTDTLSFVSMSTLSNETLTFSLTVTDDKGLTDTDIIEVNVLPVNSIPLVSMGQDISTYEQTKINLAASASDNDGEIIAYLWEQISGPSVDLSDSTLAEVKFLTPTLHVAQIVELELTVTDNENGKASDRVSITVNPINITPNVNAGVDQTIFENENVILSGVSSDPDGIIDSYQWEQISGTAVALSNSNQANCYFLAPNVTEFTQLKFRLTVSDNENSESFDDITITVSPITLAPIVNAGDNQTVDEQVTVTLSGKGADSDGSIVSYAWSQVSGTSVTLNNSSSQQASFTAPTLTKVEVLTFELKVTDNENLSASDRVQISVNPMNEAPSSNAGDNQIVDEQITVTLSGEGADSDGSIVSYAWSQVSGTSVTLNNSSSQQASFMAPTLTEVEVLTFELKVTDNENLSASDRVQISVNPMNEAPSSNAGDNQTVDEKVTVILSGEGTDSDGSIVSYAWSQVSGTSATLNNSRSQQASFTAPLLTEVDVLTFELIVTDNENLSASDRVQISVNPKNEAPSSNAGDNQTVDEQVTVILSGEGTDSDGSIVSYAWSQVSGTSVNLNNSGSQQASFTAPVLTEAEVLTFELIVTDNENLSASDRVQISVNPKNEAPSSNAGDNQTVDEQVTVTLSGEGTDSDGSIVSYAWSQVSGTSVNLNNSG
ncbi:PKD domain-containing protein, partial [Pseudoalteromonas sp. C2R02]|nr:PKD domain-containing protein [Pseudoalteromonas sp. C2R02]